MNDNELIKSNPSSQARVVFDFENIDKNLQYLSELKSQHEENQYFIKTIFVYAIQLDNIKVFSFLHEYELVDKTIYEDKNIQSVFNSSICPQIEKYVLEKRIGIVNKKIITKKI